ncbi:MAG TPA: hypothetical protein VI937_02410 [Negativicutes bacterium]|uniref:Uncharacterized protein n=1 Tax=Candidatus Staskawiczbacteria bacterium RIFCSPHIGHO2_01_FULL_41_41 TaxID=1802203 RepID=A0A1G2HUZ8_9BACT|nr:MAG: hypothetical protein A2822_02255 [Candidatus Staskawiczbacteria bacterium RIFCSPHIGHO2_01_FULL_41_41]OGZ74425.1 MAG: hypothetical protein A3A12_01495 [Candidatus Staskawiczbacteria bacterium RIFCSPLOWO2_01_FULL_43_17b]HLD70710.1 hypothetical protein [Negativicutes bacterium]
MLPFLAPNKYVKPVDKGVVALATTYTYAASAAQGNTYAASAAQGHTYAIAEWRNQHFYGIF